MSKLITVKELEKICKQEMKKGNGNKYIYISDDDEGNGYHGLYYGFSNSEETQEIFEFTSVIPVVPCEEIIILG